METVKGLRSEADAHAASYRTADLRPASQLNGLSCIAGVMEEMVNDSVDSALGDNEEEIEEEVDKKLMFLEDSSLIGGLYFGQASFQVQDRVADPAQMHSQQSHQVPGVDRMDLPNSPVYKSPFDRTAPRHMQQPYQQTPDGNSADDMLDLSGDVAMKKTIDGALLASAGDENKVFIWNLRNNLEQRSWDAHSSFITDISFRPDESMLATASSDRTLRLWDASQGDCYVQAQCFTGHSTQVTSVEFNRKNTSLLCSCDDGGKTGKAKVRFHPRGKILASAIGHTVNITDVETDERFKCLQGNRDNKPLNSICWNEHINCLACVSDNCAKVWSTEGQPVRELNRNGYFRSCSFHPRYPNTLVIGGYESITLWNLAENKVESVQAHGCHLSDLDGCLATGLLASASHDGCVKVWR
ncbi:transcriptional corepressor LEUNIG-like [Panicum miliaceum]|uniref:Transcriptional corepressor LEUNIG-like n=1 Tax=Panicum miliaceum TaxID=4540 RepID=A0A3L6SCI4_PANMI|nr:transcriptional corepressor LEUNIG-like [Panicum miliaceum]